MRLSRIERREDDWRKLSMIKGEYSYAFAAFVNFLTDEGDIEVELRE